MTDDWTDDDELTEPSDDDLRPFMSVQANERARLGDTYTVVFESDGEENETEYGKQVEFDATVTEIDFPGETSDGEPIEEGQEVRLASGSARFLSQLKDVAPVGGKAVEVTIVDTGYDSEYRCEVVGEADD